MCANASASACAQSSFKTRARLRAPPYWQRRRAGERAGEQATASSPLPPLLPPPLPPPLPPQPLPPPLPSMFDKRAAVSDMRATALIPRSRVYWSRARAACVRPVAQRSDQSALVDATEQTRRAAARRCANRN